MTIFYNAFHSPLGAHASFTLGCPGQKGGLGLELSKPADQNIFIGVETRGGGRYQALPFYEGAADETARYDPDAVKKKKAELITPFALNKIRRDYNLGTDTWTAGDLSFTVYTPAAGAPEPGRTAQAEQKLAYCPAVTAELTIDNRQGKKPRQAFFGYQSETAGDSMRRIEDDSPIGVAKGQETGIFCSDRGVQSVRGFTMEDILQESSDANRKSGLGFSGMLLATVPAGRQKTFRFAIAFYRGGMATTGISASYWYTRYFRKLENVAQFALDNFSTFKTRAKKANRLVASKKLNPAQHFQMVHAIRSYYGSTQFLDNNGKPQWVVNEGEYKMLNTFDLTVDQVFFELRMNPWTVRNVLDLFVSRYSYTDKLHFPGKPNDIKGGISFTHDMGYHNHFSRPGYSSYERKGLTGCFSYMTHEQLVNWILCAALYAKKTGDRAWLKKNLPVFKKCLISMERRDHPNAKERTGIMGLDSDRTGDGAEITTYDSLDVSLGQARNNVYIGLKGWASYLAMEEIFTGLKCARETKRSAQQAGRAAATIASFLNDKGFIPAVMGEDCDSQIIPAVEGLVFPYMLGHKEVLEKSGPYGRLIKALQVHLATVLKKGICIYPDNGWKLSSSADNSWLSKIYLCQFVVRKIMGIKSKATGIDADKAHQQWLFNEYNRYYAWSDQMRSGIARGSLYYPRGVTSILWLDE